MNNAGDSHDVGAADGGIISLIGGSGTSTGNGGLINLSAGNGGVKGGDIYTSPGIVVGNPAASGVTHIAGQVNMPNVGTAPTLTSCGTSPSVSGGDSAGRISVGSGTATCTVNFVQSWASANFT